LPDSTPGHPSAHRAGQPEEYGTLLLPKPEIASVQNAPEAATSLVHVSEIVEADGGFAYGRD
jgi:hypothetical protein